MEAVVKSHTFLTNLEEKVFKPWGQKHQHKLSFEYTGGANGSVAFAVQHVKDGTWFPVAASPATQATSPKYEPFTGLFWAVRAVYTQGTSTSCLVTYVGWNEGETMAMTGHNATDLSNVAV